MANDLKDRIKKVNKIIETNTKILLIKTKPIFKKYLVTGLIVIIPLWLTFFVLQILFNFISDFTSPYIVPALSYFISDRLWVHWVAKIISFFASISIVCVLGFLTNKVLGKTILAFFENVIKKVPLLGTIYSGTKQLIGFIFSGDGKKGFKQVLFVPYPTRGIYSLAFLTGEQMINGEKYLCVLMPPTPNPTTGFLFLCKEEDVIYTKYTIEDAFRFILSAGVLGLDQKEINDEIQKKIEENKNEL
ncbi:MAG: DUF502 domain-containing protein [Endomicrobia bacterium]|nr:DUF502 domain-containing protein [Endomicrobiia bacterium]